MGNENAKPIEVCDMDCERQKRVDAAHAEWLRLKTDPNATDAMVNKAYIDYMHALNGPNWKFQQAIADASANRQNAAGILNSRINEVQGEINILESEIEKIDREFEHLAEKEKEIDTEIIRGQQMVNTITRAAEMAQQLKNGNS